MSITYNLTTSLSSTSSAFLAPSSFNSRYFYFHLTPLSSFLWLSLEKIKKKNWIVPTKGFFCWVDSKLHLFSLYCWKCWVLFMGFLWLLQGTCFIACEGRGHLQMHCDTRSWDWYLENFSFLFGNGKWCLDMAMLVDTYWEKESYGTMIGVKGEILMWKCPLIFP